VIYYTSGIVATIHTCGNGLNYNPHVHLISTGELVNTETGEMNNVAFVQFKRIRFTWMDEACRLFRKMETFSEVEITAIKERYAYGFHVHFKPIIGTESEVLFRTAEYFAAGYFHNSQILAVDHAKKTVTFRCKSWLDVRTKEKSYKTVTMDIYEFMAKMLYFLPKLKKLTFLPLFRLIIETVRICASTGRENAAIFERRMLRQAQHKNFKAPVRGLFAGDETVTPNGASDIQSYFGRKRTPGCAHFPMYYI